MRSLPSASADGLKRLSKIESRSHLLTQMVLTFFVMSIKVERWSESTTPDAADLRRRLQSEGYSVFQWSDAAGTHYGAHSHPEDQSHWILSGELELRVGDETYTLSAGDRDFLAANTTHSAFVPGDEPVTYLIGAKG
jgi:quercetin dioxygenase-like cupin family protein